MKAITIRNVDEPLAAELERERKRRGKSLNQTVLDLLRRSLGISSEEHDNGLGALAGSWSETDLAEFESAVSSFERVDEELWR